MVLSVDSGNTRGKGVITENKISEYRSGKNSPTREEKAMLLVYYGMMDEFRRDKKTVGLVFKEKDWETDPPLFKKEEWEFFWIDPEERLRWLNDQLCSFAEHGERGALYLKLPSDIALYCCLRFDGKLEKYHQYSEQIHGILARKIETEEHINAKTQEFLNGEEGSAGLLGQLDVEAVFRYVEHVHLYYAGVYEHIIDLLLPDLGDVQNFSKKEKCFERYIDKKNMPAHIRYAGRFSRNDILMLFAVGGKSVEEVNEALEYASYRPLQQPGWETADMTEDMIKMLSEQERTVYLEWEWYQAYLREDWNNTWCNLERLGCVMLDGNAGRSAIQKHMTAFRRYYFHYGAVYQNKFVFRIWYAALLGELILSKEGEELYTEIILSDEFVDKVKYKHNLIDTAEKREKMVGFEDPIIQFYNSRHDEYCSEKDDEQGIGTDHIPSIFENRMENMTGRETGCYHLLSFLKKYRGEVWREEWRRYAEADRVRAAQAMQDFHFVSILYSCFTGLIFKGGLDTEYKAFLYADEKGNKEDKKTKETKNDILRMVNTVLGGDGEYIFPYKLGERYQTGRSYLERYLKEAQKWDRGKS